MKLRLKYFGMGLFIAGLLFALVEKLDLPIQIVNNPQSSSDEKNEDYEHKISKLEAQITVLQQETETNGNIAAKTDVNGSKEKVENNSTAYEGSSNESNEPISGTIYIYENISLYSIGQQVEDLGIVSNGRELELFLSKPEYARSIQKGVFELTSEMTIEQIANTLTGKS